MRTGSLQDLIDSVLMVCGTPDQCYQQIKDFIEYTGGMSNLLVMAQAGFLNHEDTCDSLTLLAKEILPRLKEFKQPGAAECSGGINVAVLPDSTALPATLCCNSGAVWLRLADCVRNNLTTITVDQFPQYHGERHASSRARF